MISAEDHTMLFVHTIITDQADDFHKKFDANINAAK